MGEFDTARLIYLSIFGFALLVGIFSLYRGRLSQAMQHAAIWVLIFLGGTLLAANWAPLEEALFPDRARVSTTGAEIVLRRAGTSGHFFATAEVNGVPVRFIVDTGASQVVLSRADAARVGFGPQDLNFIGSALTANGTVSQAPVVLASVTLGGLEKTNVRASVNGGELDISLLGMTYLDRFASISMEGDTLTLRR